MLSSSVSHFCLRSEGASEVFATTSRRSSAVSTPDLLPPAKRHSSIGTALRPSLPKSRHGRCGWHRLTRSFSAYHSRTVHVRPVASSVKLISPGGLPSPLMGPGRGVVWAEPCPRLPRREALTRQRGELFVLRVPLTPRAIRGLAALQLVGQVVLCAYGARSRLAQLLHEKFVHIDLPNHCGHGHVDRQELLAARRLDHTLPSAEPHLLALTQLDVRALLLVEESQPDGLAQHSARVPENDVDALLPAGGGESLPGDATGLDAHEDARSLALHRAHEHLVAIGGDPRGEAPQELRQYLPVGLLALLRRELGLVPGLGALHAVPSVVLGIPPRDKIGLQPRVQIGLQPRVQPRVPARNFALEDLLPAGDVEGGQVGRKAHRRTQGPARQLRALKLRRGDGLQGHGRSAGGVKWPESRTASKGGALQLSGLCSAGAGPSFASDSSRNASTASGVGGEASGAGLLSIASQPRLARPALSASSTATGDFRTNGPSSFTRVCSQLCSCSTVGILPAARLDCTKARLPSRSCNRGVKADEP
eukprot:scaffold59530_cov68-Phaeocystis_antarctica.AAC.4